METFENTLSFHTETRGMIHFIWPVDNHYFTEYDPISYGIRRYTKSVHQGRYSGELNCQFISKNSQLDYNGKSVSVVDSVQNIFTLLVRISAQSVEDLDTKWFPMNHEGQPHRARFLWIGTDTIEINNVDIVCDHYQLDIEKTEGRSVQVSLWDYFTDHVASDEALRQIWVEHNSQRRIIRAYVSCYGMNVTAEIQE